MLLARTAEKGFTPGYQRHKPEQTLLYQIIEHHYPEFQTLMEAHDCMDAGARVTQEQLPQIAHYLNMCNKNLMNI